MHRLLLATALSLLAGASAFASGLGKLHSFRDWELGCDNTQRCEAQGYGSEGDGAPPGGRAALIIRRGMGAAEPPVLRFTYSASADAPPAPSVGQSVEVRVAGLRFRMPVTSEQRPEPEVPAAQLAPLLRAVLEGEVIRLTAGQSQWQVSLDGAKAALLKMDELQGRVGTPGALVRKGTRLPPQRHEPAAPEVQAARLAPTTSADLQLANRLAPVLAAPGQCYDLDPADVALTIVRLTASRLLVLQPCSRSGNEISSRLWLVGDRPPFPAQRLELPMPDGTTADEVLVNAVSGGDTLSLHDYVKGGSGDCGESRDWTWAGGRLVLVGASASPCRQFGAGGVGMDLWRATVK